MPANDVSVMLERFPVPGAVVLVAFGMVPAFFR